MIRIIFHSESDYKKAIR